MIRRLDLGALIRLPDQRWRGENTDGVGLMTDLARLRVPLAGRRIVILGAGGATRGILGPLLATKLFGFFISAGAPVKVPGAAFFAGAVLLVLGLINARRTFAQKPG